MGLKPTTFFAVITTTFFQGKKNSIEPIYVLSQDSVFLINY
jgi:hypothetical protein